jgi:hypothetical protein
MEVCEQKFPIDQTGVGLVGIPDYWMIPTLTKVVTGNFVLLLP